MDSKAGIESQDSLVLKNMDSRTDTSTESEVSSSVSNNEMDSKTDDISDKSEAPSAVLNNEVDSKTDDTSTEKDVSSPVLNEVDSRTDDTENDVSSPVSNEVDAQTDSTNTEKEVSSPVLINVDDSEPDDASNKNEESAAASKEEDPAKKPNFPECRLWMGNLDSKLREYNLLKMVEKFGPLAEFDFLYHRSGPQIGQPRGFAFVTYSLLEDAHKAQRTMDGLEVLGRRMAVKWAHIKEESKFLGRSKPTPPILGIQKDIEDDENPVAKMSPQCKIAALEAQLKMLDENRRMDFTPDVGGGPTRPTSVVYHYIEPKTKNGAASNHRRDQSHAYAYPYNARARRK